MEYTLRQLLDEPSHVLSLTTNGRIRLKTDLEHFIEHEHVLTQRIRMCQTALQIGHYPNAELGSMKTEIAAHQITIQQLHTLYAKVCDDEYNALSTPLS